MHNAAWAALLKHIPADQQNGYMLVTTSGVEIAVQAFLRVESELLVFKGRLAGSQDQGLLFFLPYASIAYIGTTKAVKDSEVIETFGSLEFPEPAAVFAPSVVLAAAQEPPPNPVEPPANGVKTEAPGSKPGIRSEVLERFRSRGGGGGSSLNFPSPAQQP